MAEMLADIDAAETRLFLSDGDSEELSLVMVALWAHNLVGLQQLLAARPNLDLRDGLYNYAWHGMQQE